MAVNFTGIPGLAVLSTRSSRLGRFARFGMVGASGLIINTLALLVAVSVFNVHYLVGAVLATQASTTWNFALSELWVFERGRSRWNLNHRFVQFWVMNNAALFIRGPIIWLLTERLDAYYAMANLMSLLLILVLRYAIAEQVIWRPAAATGVTPLNLVPDPSKLPKTWITVAAFVAVAVPAAVLRVLYLGSLGFNSDEAVYAGQGASLAGDPVLIEYFPIFRAHPLLFQTTLSVVFKAFGTSALTGRLVAVCFGLATVWICYLLGRTLFDSRTGLIAALILAVMPYHVVVTRQVLLDGPMVFFSTLALYLLARFATTGRGALLYASAAAMGLTVLTNERSIVLLGGVYLFFALVPSVKVRFSQLIVSMMIFAVMITAYPMSVFFSGKSTTGEQFLAWQLFRRANHGLEFYLVAVPPAVGWITIIVAVAGLVLLRGRLGWREALLGCWCVVPFAFFEIWPVKGFQYLLALAPPIAILAGRALSEIPDRLPGTIGQRWPDQPKGLIRVTAIVLVAAMLASASYSRIAPARAGESFLAGSGGVPGGREAGVWVGENLPEGAELMAIGPSMANIIQWYGDRKTYGLSVSPNPLHRNPVYEPIVNPDLLLRNGDLHYLVWDSFSASRSDFFSEKLLTFAERYHGRIVHQEFIEVTTEDGETVQQPVIVIYEVRP